MPALVRFFQRVGSGAYGTQQEEEEEEEEERVTRRKREVLSKGTKEEQNLSLSLSFSLSLSLSLCLSLCLSPLQAFKTRRDDFLRLPVQQAKRASSLEKKKFPCLSGRRKTEKTKNSFPFLLLPSFFRSPVFP